MNEEIKRAMEEYEEAAAKLRVLAKRQYQPNECPIKDTHYETSQALWGTSCVWWNCEFCGREFYQ